MFFSKCQFTIFVLFLINLLNEIESLRCYTCTALVSNECRDPFELSNVARTGECTERNDVCVKHITPANYLYPEDIKRGCANENYCKFLEDNPNPNLKSEEEICETCSSHLCNFSTKLTTLSLIINFCLFYILRLMT